MNLYGLALGYEVLREVMCDLVFLEVLGLDFQTLVFFVGLECRGGFVIRIRGVMLWRCGYFYSLLPMVRGETRDAYVDAYVRRLNLEHGNCRGWYAEEWTGKVVSGSIFSIFQPPPFLPASSMCVDGSRFLPASLSDRCQVPKFHTPYLDTTTCPSFASYHPLPILLSTPSHPLVSYKLHSRSAAQRIASLEKWVHLGLIISFLPPTIKIHLTRYLVC
ncbi:hypothetical protein P280DRAFT_144613 [Massarina eburnea CBS 473.64]|uniref:Uncharacterized protein n=1 Tax=Massarina eburnea CBS 473.64 TaxID=1395130 RepID=A0A6A6RSC2_9PLEO|nr:hypothetical protein P280DRAFT_144613 [Massarina eburnea CBS 473.64]